MDLKQILAIIITNPVRKIFAIIFAFGLWFFVSIGNDYQYTRDIKIIYSDLPDTLVIVDSVASVNVTFTGRGGSLLSTWAAPPKARCAVRNVSLGTNEISVKRLFIPMGFADLTTTYNTIMISIDVDLKTSKQIDVAVPVKGSPNQSFAIDHVIVLDTVFISGPRKALKDLSTVATETLNVRNRNKTFTKKLRLTLESPLLDVSRKDVAVEVVVDSSVEKSFTNIPLRLLFTPDQRVSSDKAVLDTLIVRGARSRIRELQRRDITVQIRLTKLSPGEYNLPATILLPDYITPVYSEPQRFNIVIY
jgi:hypothetical protein